MAMAMGPVEYIVIEFPGDQFHAELLPAIKELVAAGTVRIIDLLVIKKEANGSVQWFEAEQLGGEEAKLFTELEGEVDDLVNAEDIQLVAQRLAPNSTAWLLVWENAWAARFAEAARKAQGRVIAQERIPSAIVQAAVEAMRPVSVQH